MEAGNAAQTEQVRTRSLNLLPYKTPFSLKKCKPYYGQTLDLVYAWKKKCHEKLVGES